MFGLLGLRAIANGFCPVGAIPFSPMTFMSPGSESTRARKNDKKSYARFGSNAIGFIGLLCAPETRRCARDSNRFLAGQAEVGARAILRWPFGFEGGFEGASKG